MNRLALAALLVAAPALAEDIPGMHLVCVPTRPHMHHAVHRVMHFLPPRPSIRHHPHHHRICHHAHQRCHWEEDLGGPAGGFPAYGGMEEGFGSAEGGGEGFGTPDMGGDIGGGLGSAVLGPLSFVQPFAITGVLPAEVTPSTYTMTPVPTPSGYTVTPVTPPTVAIPEPSTWAMLLLGCGALLMIKKWRRVRGPV